MFTAYAVVSVLLAVMLAASATADFVRYKKIGLLMAEMEVPESWMTNLGLIKAAGAIGLLVGIGVPMVPVAAATGIILFFVGAVTIHLRAGDYSFALAVVFGLLAVAALVLRLPSA